MIQSLQPSLSQLSDLIDDAVLSRWLATTRLESTIPLTSDSNLVKVERIRWTESFRNRWSRCSSTSVTPAQVDIAHI